MTPSQQTEFIGTALKQPATMALIRLETQKESIPVLREAQESERTGKARWQVLNQLRMWLLATGETP